MRDALPDKCWKYERGIINIDDSDGPGTHWTGYIRKNNEVKYFDPFGNLKPPLNFLNYMKDVTSISYNRCRYQPDNTVICGHLCLEFLCE